MKVVLKIELDVDEEAWANEFSVEPRSLAVRNDVKQYFDVMCYEHLRSLGLNKEEHSR